MYLLCWKNQFEEGRGGEVNNHEGSLLDGGYDLYFN